MESPDNLREMDAAAVYARMEELQKQMEEMRLQLQATVKLEAVNEQDKRTIKSALQDVKVGTSSRKVWLTNLCRLECSSSRRPRRSYN